jgi:transposase
VSGKLSPYQATLFPERIEDYIDEENPVRAIEAFVELLDL